MADIEKEIVKEEKVIKRFFLNKANIWMTVSIILAIALIISLASGSLGLGNVSKDVAGQKVMDFAKTNGIDATLVSVAAKGSFYEVTVSVQGQEIPLYVTKDGKSFTQQLIDFTPASKTDSSDNSAQTATTAPKSDKPNVTLWVFSYCPYGTQTEKGLIPVYNLLKNKADINIKYIGAMHGEFEKIESLRQLCIQKNYGQDKFMGYIIKLDTNASVGNCGGADSCISPIINGIYKSLGIDKTKIDNCMTSDAPALYAAQEQEASSLGISGSPTFVINGVQIQSSRSPAALLTTVCSAFNNAPSECSQTLDSASPSAGFGATASESASAAQCG